jgi:GNAT superfamily N-acetyltransferase
MSENIKPEHFDVRRAIESDFKELPALENEADMIFSNIFSEPEMNELPPSSSEDELRQSKMVLVAGDPPVGFARIDELNGLAHLEQLSVTPDQGGKGIGGKLLEEACAWAVQNGYKAIILSTFRDIPWNAPFYARHGFEVINELTPELESLKQHEIDIGISEFGPRVIMMRLL